MVIVLFACRVHTADLAVVAALMGDIVPIKKHREFGRQQKRSAAGVLRDCRARHPTDVLVMGYDAEGRFFVQGEPPDPGQALWLMELARKKLTEGGT